MEIPVQMIAVARSLADALVAKGLPVFKTASGTTSSHQFAIEAKDFGGGHTASKKLRQAGFLACGIGLPIAAVAGDMNGLRIGTPELVRWGVTPQDCEVIAGLIAEGLYANRPKEIAPRTASLRATFNELHYIL